MLPLDNKFLNYFIGLKAAAPAVLNQMPEHEAELPPEFVQNHPHAILEEIERNAINVPPVNYALEGANRFCSVLQELDKLKGKLGGSPFFGSSPPKMDEGDNLKLCFGVPLTACKDWLRMILDRGWQPKLFWKTIAGFFDVREGDKSQYEEAHVRIQQFGLLIANKERFFFILNFREEKHYQELSLITGLAWHPNSNGAGTEKMYIEFVEIFLTDYFEAAKKQGENALIEYFNAFQGVCFEGRVRNLEEYALKHPIERSIEIPPDWDTGKPVEVAYIKETQAVYEKTGKAPTPKELFIHLKEKGVFDLEFTVGNKTSKPSEVEFYKWALVQVDDCILSEEGELA